MAREEMAADTAHVRRLSRRLVDGVRSQLEHVVFNGDEANTYDGCVNLSFAYVEVSERASEQGNQGCQLSNPVCIGWHTWAQEEAG